MSDETRRREDERVREHEQILREASDTPLAREMARERESAELLHARAQEQRDAAPAAAEPSAERRAAEAAEFAREQAALGPEGRAARAQHRRAVARAAAQSARRTTPEQQALLFRVAGLGMALAGIFLLFQGLQQQGLLKEPLPTLAPASAAAKPTATLAPPPIAQASPQVNGTGIATASFTKVSGPCRLAAQFADRYSFAASGGALTLTQLSDNHVTTGRIEPNGDFTTTATGQGYTGRVSGTTAEGQHTYTADGCNEVYAFKMTFPTTLIAAPVAPATIAAAVLTPTPPPAASTVVSAPSPATPTPPTPPTPGPNVALAALGLILTVGGLGVAARGPRFLRANGDEGRDA